MKNKKYIGIIISIIILAFGVSAYIFRDTILDMDGIFPGLFSILIVWAVYIHFFVCLYKIIKKKEFLNIISICLLIPTLFFYTKTFDMNTTKDFFDKLDQRTEVVNLIKDGELSGDDYNNIVLPDKYKKTSYDGSVHVYKNEEDNQIIGFWISRGINSDSKLYIYSSKGQDTIIEEFGEEYCDVNHVYDNWYYVISYWYEKDYYSN